MSASIRWRPTSDKGKCFHNGTSSSFDRLRRALGGSEFGPEHVMQLRAMAIAAADPFYNEVADVIENVGSIEIWTEY